LRACYALLEQGLRTEAIAECELPPNVLAQFAILDFPELSDWNTLLQRWNMILPPELFSDLAMALNEAYSQEQPLLTLLAKHRLLALGRAPIAARLHVLRQLSQLDPQNLAWQDDLAEMEKARIEQLRKEVETAITNRDPDLIAQLQAELFEQFWSVPLPPEVTEPLVQAGNDVVADETFARMQELAAELQYAQQVGDLQAAKVASEEWVQKIALVEVLEDDPLGQMVMPVFAWMQEQEELQEKQSQFGEIVTELNRGLDEREAPDELEKIANSAAEFGTPLPVETQQRLEKHYSQHELQERRRHRLILFGSLGLVALAGVVFLILVLLDRKGGDIEGTVAAIRKRINDHMLEGAEKYIEELRENRPSVYLDDAVQAEIAKLQGLLKEERERKQSFEFWHDKAKNESGRPSDMVMRKLRGFARTPTELSQVETLAARAPAQQGKADKDKKTSND